jgi:hypothetical protein
MPTPDLLTLIRRACEGTSAEELAPHLNGSVPYCRADCPHYRDSTSCAARSGLIVEDVCEPAAEALARLAVEGAAEVERLTEALRVATAGSSPVSSGGEAEPVEVEGVELVWNRTILGWMLLLPDGLMYASASGMEHTLDIYDRSFGRYIRYRCDHLEAGCKIMADRARADGYRVPPHPLGWDVGGGE